MANVTIEKQWDGNECEREANGRIYVSKGRWQWVVVVDGEAESAHDLRREARERADRLQQDQRAQARTEAVEKGTRCFACDRVMRQRAHRVETIEGPDLPSGQSVFVGPDCFAKVRVAGAVGYQPPRGGPRLRLLQTFLRRTK